jgi:hypothetical protein
MLCDKVGGEGKSRWIAKIERLARLLEYWQESQCWAEPSEMSSGHNRNDRVFEL